MISCTLEALVDATKHIWYYFKNLYRADIMTQQGGNIEARPTNPRARLELQVSRLQTGLSRLVQIGESIRQGTFSPAGPGGLAIHETLSARDTAARLRRTAAV